MGNAINRNQYGHFVAERAKGSGYQVRNLQTGGLSWRKTLKEAKVSAYHAFMRHQARVAQS